MRDEKKIEKIKFTGMLGNKKERETKELLRISC
jgi:hypothetical protein